MKCKNKAIYLSATLGLGVFAPLLALRSCPRTQPNDQVVSIYFYISLLETSLVSRFLPLIVVKPPRKFKKSLKPAQNKGAVSNSNLALVILAKILAPYSTTNISYAIPFTKRTLP